MDYQFVVTSPSGTTKSNPSIQKAFLPSGIISKVRIYFPWGCGGLVHCVIHHNQRQIYPTTPGVWYTGNNILIEFDDNYPLEENFNKVSVLVYNEDDTFEHTVTVNLVVTSYAEQLIIPLPVLEE